MKKLATLFICMFLLVLNVEASDVKISLNTSTTNIEYGETLNLSLSASSLPITGLSSAQFTINYDKEYLSFSCDNISYNQGITASEIDCNVDANGKIIIIYVDDSAGDSPIKDGDFLSLKFKTIKEPNSAVTKEFTINGDGFATVNSGTIEDITATYSTPLTVTINKKTSITKSNNAYLKDLKISNCNIKFDKNTFEYTFDVENNISSIEISATADNNKSVISGTGKKNLLVGENKFTVNVVAEDGTKKNYYITIRRKEISDNNDEKTVADITKNNTKITGTTENKNTGVRSFIIIFFIIGISGVIINFIIRKKTFFPKM